MRIGIIAERRIKPSNFFERYHREIIDNTKNPFELIIARIPYTAEKLDKISPRRVKKAILMAEGILNVSGADKIIVTSMLKKYSDIADIDRNQAFFDIVPHCIRSISPKCGIYPPDCRICIKAVKMDRIIEYLVAELCYDTKKLIISIADMNTAKSFQERFYAETGFLTEITHDHTTDTEILVDLINPSVRIGRDILIDSVHLDIYTGDCDVDSLEIAACIGKLETSKKISAYMMGKKKLTL